MHLTKLLGWADEQGTELLRELPIASLHWWLALSYWVATLTMLHTSLHQGICCSASSSLQLLGRIYSLEGTEESSPSWNAMQRHTHNLQGWQWTAQPGDVLAVIHSAPSGCNQMIRVDAEEELLLDELCTSSSHERLLKEDRSSL